MAKFKSPFDEPRHVPWLGVDVEPGQEITVDDSEALAYKLGGWEEVEPPEAGYPDLPTDPAEEARKALMGPDEDQEADSEPGAGEAASGPPSTSKRTTRKRS